MVFEGFLVVFDAITRLGRVMDLAPGPITRPLTTGLQLGGWGDVPGVEREGDARSRLFQALHRSTVNNDYEGLSKGILPS